MTAHRPEFEDYAPVAGTGESARPERGWQRLHIRMIWVDAVRSVLSTTPAALSVWVFGVEPSLGSMWPVIAIAVFGVAGAVGDAMRWVFTRYRVSSDYVERRTGVFVRKYRSVRRDRIRSVDSNAKLRHRLAGLRIIEIGAGQQTAAGESAFTLDAVSKADAEALRQELLWAPRPGPVADRIAESGTADGGAYSATIDGAEPAPEPAAAEQVFARFRLWWVVYNMFNVWAYLMAAGLLWGGYWLATIFGLNVGEFVEGLLDWETLGWGWTIAIGASVTGAIGVVGLGVAVFAENWKFELARVPSGKGTLLRTRQGLFKTREVTRDDNRLRGVMIAEPLLWRWMGMADTNVISTGLSTMSMAPSSTILPRGPLSVAKPVAAAVLDTESSPFETPLGRHPRAALRRRLVWATMFTGVVVGVLAWPAATDVVPWWSVLVGAGFWPVAMWAGWVAYRALGHAISGDYLVVRSGLVSRSTAALKRKAVSTIAIRESLFQRRLGLKTVSAMTAAGYGAYTATDVNADDAVTFALDAAPGLLDPFILHDKELGGC